MRSRKSLLIMCGLGYCLLGACETASVRHAREAVLKDDLFTFRALIKQYTLEKQHRPASLNDLVIAGYLKKVPEDPFTRRNDTWVPAFSGNKRVQGIEDVHSGSDLKDGTGVLYSDW